MCREISQWGGFDRGPTTEGRDFADQAAARNIHAHEPKSWISAGNSEFQPGFRRCVFNEIDIEARKDRVQSRRNHSDQVRQLRKSAQPFGRNDVGDVWKTLLQPVAHRLNKPTT